MNNKFLPPPFPLINTRDNKANFVYTTTWNTILSDYWIGWITTNNTIPNTIFENYNVSAPSTLIDIKWNNIVFPFSLTYSTQWSVDIVDWYHTNDDSAYSSVISKSWNALTDHLSFFMMVKIPTVWTDYWSILGIEYEWWYFVWINVWYQSSNMKAIMNWRNCSILSNISLWSWHSICWTISNTWVKLYVDWIFVWQNTATWTYSYSNYRIKNSVAFFSSFSLWEHLYSANRIIFNWTLTASQVLALHNEKNILI
jgi:hypothetical protein